MTDTTELRFVINKEVLGGMKYSLRAENDHEVLQTAFDLLRQAIVQKQNGRVIGAYDAGEQMVYPIAPRLDITRGKIV